MAGAGVQRRRASRFRTWLGVVITEVAFRPRRTLLGSHCGLCHGAEWQLLLHRRMVERKECDIKVPACLARDIMIYWHNC